MSPRPVKAALALATAAVSSLALAASPAHTASGSPVDPGVPAELAMTYAATAKYQFDAAAIRDGYVPTPCSADPKGEGAMGYHYFNESRFGSLDPTKPAGLLYEDDEFGRKRLIAAEWVVVDDDQNLKTDKDRPSLFGVPFDGPMPGHYKGMPIHYDLHAYIWKRNPRGLFYRWNPDVKCPANAAAGGH